ncbi:MAG: hypothetical protein Q7S21_05770, partial [archaeon]|nr:hypothetical protein [archaeon]
MPYNCDVALERLLREVDESKIIKDNKETIHKFFREEKVRGLKNSSLRGNVYACLRIALMFPNKKFCKMTKDDVVTFLHDLKPRSNSNHRDKARKVFSETTKVLLKIH